MLIEQLEKDTSCCEKRQLSLYLHIPFCVKKCLYCDFLSFESDQEHINRYVITLIKEIEKKALLFKDYELKTIFFGGGTPSLLNGKQLSQIMDAVKMHFNAPIHCEHTEMEISMEINPGTVTREKLSAYYQAGINRISIGLQSANNQELKLLGRIHTYEDFQKTYQMARSIGFQNVNVDIMSALPNQTLEQYKDTLEKILNLEPEVEHISAYSLILEEGTYFYDHYEYLDEETDRSLYELTKNMLLEKGYYRYEISNYAKTGHECLHNEVYWRRKEYLGLGLGASSFLAEKRFKNTNDLNQYLEEDFSRYEEQELTKQEQMEEFMFLGLRLTKGISINEFESNFKVSLYDVYGKEIKQLMKEGLLCLDDYHQHFTLSQRGFDLSNYVFRHFLK